MNKGKPREIFGKGGKRADLDNRYFRSKMEANCARYLNFLKANGEIKDWQYECEIFKFEKITRGTTEYRPDFKITRTDGSVYYIEVKGYMDAKSKTILKRMAKYYPQVKIEIMNKSRYKEILKWAKVIKGWE